MRRAYFTQPRHGPSRPNIEVEVGIVGELDGDEIGSKAAEANCWKHARAHMLTNACKRRA